MVRQCKVGQFAGYIMMPYTVKGLRKVKGDDVNIVISLKKLGQCVEDINECCNCGSCMCFVYCT